MAHYRTVLDLAGVNDSRSLALGRVPARSTVLDIGIGDGTLGRTLRAMGCEMSGIEYDKELAEESDDVYENLVVGDVEQIDLVEAFGGRRFDVVLMLDVLEHLRQPEVVLERVRDLLADDGYVVVSLPNIAHAAVKLQLLAGRFTYTEEGLLDETHLRFFDATSVDALFDEAGYSVFDLARVTRPADGTEIPVDLATLPEDVVEAAVSDPESETYQFVATAAPKGSPVLASPPVLVAKELQHLVRTLQEELEAYRSAGGRPWLDVPTVDWIEGQLGLLRGRLDEHREMVAALTRHFQATVEELRSELADIPPTT